MSQTWSISPRFTNAKLQGARLEDKIDVFEDQMNGWLLDHALALCPSSHPNHQQAGFAAIALATAYFETIEAHCRGQESRGQSKPFFREGFLKVFPDLAAALQAAGCTRLDGLAAEVAEEVYEQLRCGLFHEAMAKHKVLIRSDNAPVGFMVEKETGHIGAIVIDPHKFVEAIRAHFVLYLRRLRDPGERQLREAFERLFDLRLTRGSVVMPPPAGTRANRP